MDNDNYSDGMTTPGCSQPPGYKLAANLLGLTNDCNDSDPLQFPGQVWFKDADNDGYSNGVILLQCLQPTGFKAASQLLGTGIDCNDANSSINPAAPEICNGMDDDCDGLVDEGASGGLTYVGNVTFTNQVQVNAWSACYSVIQGNLLVQNSGINSLATLSSLLKVTGNVTIKNTSLVTLNGLHSLDTIGGNLLIQTNNFGAKLQSLDGLEDLDWVGGTLKVYNNTDLTDCCAIHDLIGGEPNGVGGTISIYSNETGCDNVGEINVACTGVPIIAPPGGIAQVEPARSSSLFPNPASKETTVLIHQDFQEGEVQVPDLQGRILISKKVESVASVSLEVAALPSGVYFVNIRLDGERFVERLIINED